jgi:hypothetical protein
MQQCGARHWRHGGATRGVRSAAVGKGFGSSSPKRSSKTGGGGSSPSSASPAQQAADAALTDALRASAPKVRPVNLKEAARGKVDYVQVGVLG